MVRWRWGLDLNGLGILGEMAQLGEIAIGKLPPEADRRRAWSLNFLGRQGKECFAPIDFKGVGKGCQVS